MEYNGISRDTLFLLADNRFRNSKDFYEEHKEEIKAGIIIPLRQIAGIIGEDMIKLDPLMNTNPVRMVSRVRRDNRYTKDKSLYRDNLWVMFMRDKHKWQNYPCFWFEVTQETYNIGIGIFGDDRGVMDCLRKNIRENTDEFKKAVTKCEKTGALLYGDSYKRMPEGCPRGMEPYYNKKHFGFIAFSGDLDDLANENIIDIIRGYYKAYSPLYTFLLKVADEYFSEGE